MIADVDETLRVLLADELAKVPGCPVYERAQIGFDAPAAAESVQSASARVNLFLHDVRENVELRDESFRFPRSAQTSDVGKRRAAVRLNLSYLVTVYVGDDARSEHRLLSQVLGVLMRCLSVPTNYLQGVLENVGANGITLSTAQPDQATYADPPTLWQALGGNLRPALGLLVTAPFDPFETRWNRVVRDARFAMVPAPSPQGFAPNSPANSETTPTPSSRNGSAGVAPKVAGIVLDGLEETPIENVALQVLAEGAIVPAASTCSDARGLFALDLPTGTHQLRFLCNGYQVREAEVVVPKDAVAEPLIIALRAMAPEEREAQNTERMKAVWDGKVVAATSTLSAVASPATAATDDGVSVTATQPKIKTVRGGKAKIAKN